MDWNALFANSPAGLIEAFRLGFIYVPIGILALIPVAMLLNAVGHPRR